MIMKRNIVYSALLCLLVFTGCSDVLDRPSETTIEDRAYWTSEEKVRLYANEFYTYFFPGYGNGWTVVYAPMQYIFSDDVVNLSTQTSFQLTVPTSIGSTSTSVDSWQSLYAGPTWNLAWIRKANVMLDRIHDNMQGILTTEEYNHWTSIGRFFRALEYARLVNVFGDVPYYNHEVANTNKDELYKDRTPRNEVMDSVYNDFRYAMQNVRLDDGTLYINRYVVAAFVSRWALFEGSWQKYYYKNDERAAKFFQLAIEAGDMVIGSGKYDIVTDFRTLFGSEDLTSNKDVIFSRKYSTAQGVTHSIASLCNMYSTTSQGPTLDLIKAFTCIDGKDYKTSTVNGANDFSLDNLIKTRDPRFEATFYGKTTPLARSTYLYVDKFIPRSALNWLTDDSKDSPDQTWQSVNNVTSYPVMRYAEVLLNWIEAKAEYATLGGASVTQADIDASINKIRHRPLDETAVVAGVQKTADMNLTNLDDDPARDADVPQLLWEIRRERRMEFAFEYARIIDLRRWGKLEYMDTDTRQDLLCGTWVNFPTDNADQLTTANVGKLRVVNSRGNLVTYDGKNGSSMVGFFYPAENKPRVTYLNQPNVNIYLCPIGYNNIVDYVNKGYTLTQTEGWPATNN